jgi:tetratricopeptide (TPR) repeat protein
MRHALILLLLTGFLFGCGALKKSKDENVHSSADFPYIEKFHEATRLKIRGQIDDAITAYEACLTMKNDDDAVYYALSELYLMKNDLAKSSYYIEFAANLDPENIWYIQELAYMYFEQGEFDLAVVYFEKLLIYEPRNVEWLYGYAESLVRNGKISDAIKALDNTEAQVGLFPELSIQKFQLYVQLKEWDKAENELLEARKLFPQDPQILAFLIDLYFQQGKQNEAVSFLKQLVEADPQNGNAHMALADAYQQQGEMALAMNEFKLAIACTDIDLDTKMKVLISIYENSYKVDPSVYDLLNALIITYPDQAKPYSIKGDFLMKDEKNEEALQSYRKALEFDQGQYPIWNQVMLMEYEAGKFQDLYTDSKKCLEYFPAISTVYLLNGIAAVQIKEYQQAIDVLTVGKDFSSGDNVLSSEIYAQLGEAYFGLKKKDDAVTAYNLAVEKNKTNTLIKNNFAFRLAQCNYKLDLAEKMIDEVLIIEANQPNFIDTKGLVVFQKGQYKEALEFFLNAAALNPTDAIINEHAGDAYFKTDETDKAVSYWEKAKELGSTNSVLDKKINMKQFYEPQY